MGQSRRKRRASLEESIIKAKLAPIFAQTTAQLWPQLVIGRNTETNTGTLSQLFALTNAPKQNEFRLVWKMAGAAGFEPATYGFGDRRSTN